MPSRPYQSPRLVGTRPPQRFRAACGPGAERRVRGVVIIRRGLARGAGLGAVYGAVTIIAWVAFINWRDHEDNLGSAIGLSPFAAVVGALVGAVLGGLTACVVVAVRPPDTWLARTAAAACGVPLFGVLVLMLFVPITHGHWGAVGILAVGTVTGGLAAPRLTRP